MTGLPVEREIPTKMVDESLEEHFNTIIDNVKVILERTPPELAADIYRHGIYPMCLTARLTVWWDM